MSCTMTSNACSLLSPVQTVSSRDPRSCYRTAKSATRGCSLIMGLRSHKVATTLHAIAFDDASANSVYSVRPEFNYLK
jgi:hypothetical protein